MRYDKHVTLKANLLALISVVTGTYILYNVGKFVSDVQRLKEYANWSKGETTLIVELGLATLIVFFAFSLLAFGRHYDQMPIFNIMLAFLLGYSFGMLFGTIRHLFFKQYYGTVGMRIAESVLILCMFVIPHRLYSMRRYCIKEPKEPKKTKKFCSKEL